MKDKIVRSTGKRDSTKYPRAKEPVSVRSPRAQELNVPQKRPIWSFSRLDIRGPYCWSQLDGQALIVVLDKLKNYETMTWSEIEGRRNHFIATSDFAALAKKRLVEIKMDDEDQLFSLRLEGMTRIFGIRDEHVLRIVWYDPEHHVCASTLKHT